MKTCFEWERLVLRNIEFSLWKSLLLGFSLPRRAKAAIVPTSYRAEF